MTGLWYSCRKCEPVNHFDYWITLLVNTIWMLSISYTVWLAGVLLKNMHNILLRKLAHAKNVKKHHRKWLVLKCICLERIQVSYEGGVTWNGSSS